MSADLNERVPDDLNYSALAQLALDLPCPSCKAKRLTPCVSPLGIAVHGSVHQGRIDVMIADRDRKADAS